jgi:hypothetical protein
MFQPWQPMCHGEASHLLQSIKVEMPESLMPTPSNIVAMGSETNWPGNLKMEEVEAIPTTPDLGKELTLLIPYAKHTSLISTCVTLVKLTNVDDGVLWAWDVEDAAESLVFTILASEDDGIDALDFDDRAVAEFDGASDRSVNFIEVAAMACHVICGAGVEVPTLHSLIVATHLEVGLCLRLVNVKKACSEL